MSDASTSHPLLEGYAVHLQIPVAWGQMDSFAHVNNTQYFRWFEDVRMHYFEAIGLVEHMRVHQVGPILAHTQCRFMAPLAYPDTVHLGTTVSDIGDDRFTMHYRVVSAQQGCVAAEGTGRIVIFDYASGQKAPIPADIRARIDALSP